MIISVTEQELQQINWEGEDFFWETFHLRMQQIRDLYLGYKILWVIDYRGGKDSTLMLQQ